MVKIQGYNIHELGYLRFPLPKGTIRCIILRSHYFAETTGTHLVPEPIAHRVDQWRHSLRADAVWDLINPEKSPPIAEIQLHVSLE